MIARLGPLGLHVARYLNWRLGEGDAGKTFLLGMRDVAPAFCVAAGLGDEAARKHFVTLGRYLLHDRFNCPEFSVAWPAQLDDNPVYVIDALAGGKPKRCLLGDPTDGLEPEVGGLLDALQQPSGRLPGILRRDLDSLFEAFRLPLDPGIQEGNPLNLEVNQRDS